MMRMRVSNSSNYLGPSQIAKSPIIVGRFAKTPIRWRLALWSRGDASDIEGQAEGRASGSERVKTPLHQPFVLIRVHSWFKKQKAPGGFCGLAHLPTPVAKRNLFSYFVELFRTGLELDVAAVLQIDAERVGCVLLQIAS